MIISLTITESEIQIVDGIPKNLTIETSIPAVIFYTFDGFDPTVDSLIYFEPIELPTSPGSVVINILATNGVDSSAIITKNYGPDVSAIHYPRDTVLGLSPYKEARANNFPFGGNGRAEGISFGGSGGVIVDGPGGANIPDGYDGTGTNTPSNYTDLPLNDYELLFSTTDSQGLRGRGIGDLPATISVRPITSPPNFSKTSSPFFNPRAVIVYQDSREPPFDESVSMLNRAQFNLERPEDYKDGIALSTTAYDGDQATGNFIKQHYNPTANTITYYYFDSNALRWVISTEPFQPNKNTVTDLSNMLFDQRGKGVGLIFAWRPFGSRKSF